jgi:glucokinase
MQERRSPPVPSVQEDQSDESLAIAVEIGGRGQRVVLATARGEIVDSAQSIAHDAGAFGTVEIACGLIDQVLARRRNPAIVPVGIGIAFGGPVDAGRGITIRSHRIDGFEQFPLVGVFEERFGLRTVIENDARAAAVGEYTFGAGRGSRDMVYLHLGHGVGGGIILSGRLQHGSSMTSGELGHMVVAADGPRCSCGKPGHLEAYASESAIVSRMRARLAETTEARALTWLDGPGITTRRIFERYSTDEDARFIVDETVQVIGLAAANLVTALNPDAVVIGGYVAENAVELTSAIRAKIRQYAFDAAARRVTVAAGDLGSDAALIGAIVLVTQ